MKKLVLFFIPAFIWGSTWLVITFQLGIVDPLVSVVYRFALAAIILFIYLFLRKQNLKYSFKEHIFMVMQGFFLFGINYWMVYLAETSLASGLVAIIFSMILFFNILNGRIFLNSPIRRLVLIGGIIGIFGNLLLFRSEIINFNLSNATSLALVLALGSAFIASLGNILSSRNQKMKLPVLQTNAFGMLYGSLLMLLITFIAGKPITFDLSFSYINSLFYLSVFGSIFAFGSYLTLLGQVGADKAAYAILVVPLIAIILSTIFEGYLWTMSGVVGVLLILAGNLLVLRQE